MFLCFPLDHHLQHFADQSPLLLHFRQEISGDASTELLSHALLPFPPTSPRNALHVAIKAT